MKVQELSLALADTFSSKLLSNVVAHGEVTIEVAAKDIVSVCETLRDETSLQFEQLIDICGVDYSEYGNVEWATDSSSSTGFSRGVEPNVRARLRFGDEPDYINTDRPRFAAIYHLMSVANNHRLRVRVYWENDALPVIPSVINVWPVVNWFEREAFDLFGIIFEGHPDLRRILTDYGFVGHPFRKDFPLTGNVEMRYDPEKQRVVYQPVSIEPRINQPRIMRDDNRYMESMQQEEEQGDA